MSHPFEALEIEVEKINPRFFLSENLLKAVKDWETGREYKVELKVKQIGKHDDLGQPVEGRFEILSAKDVTGESSDDRLLEEGESVEFIDKVIN